MPRGKKSSAEQIGVTDQRYCRRKKNGGMQVDQAKRLSLTAGSVAIPSTYYACGDFAELSAADAAPKPAEIVASVTQCFPWASLESAL